MWHSDASALDILKNIKKEPKLFWSKGDIINKSQRPKDKTYIRFELGIFDFSKKSSVKDFFQNIDLIINDYTNKKNELYLVVYIYLDKSLSETYFDYKFIEKLFKYKCGLVLR
jgi:hypothetical protein